ADAHYNQTDQQWSKNTWLLVTFVGDRQNHHQENGCSDDLIDKTGHRRSGKRRKGCKDTGGLFKQRIHFLELQTVVEKDNRSARDLGQHVRSDFAPGESAEDREGQSDRWIQVRSGDLSCDVDSHDYAESPGDRDVSVSAVHNFARNLVSEKNGHGDDAGSE